MLECLLLSFSLGSTCFHSFCSPSLLSTLASLVLFGLPFLSSFTQDAEELIRKAFDGMVEAGYIKHALTTKASGQEALRRRKREEITSQRNMATARQREKASMEMELRQQELHDLLVSSSASAYPGLSARTPEQEDAIYWSIAHERFGPLQNLADLFTHGLTCLLVAGSDLFSILAFLPSCLGFSWTFGTPPCAPLCKTTSTPPPPSSSR